MPKAGLRPISRSWGEWASTRAPPWILGPGSPQMGPELPPKQVLLLLSQPPCTQKQWTLWPKRAFRSYPTCTSAGGGVPTSASFLRVPHRTHLGQLPQCSTLEGVGICLRGGGRMGQEVMTPEALGVSLQPRNMTAAKVTIHY